MGGALIKAKMASVCYGPKVFLLLDFCDVSNLAFWHVPFFFFTELCFHLLILAQSMSEPVSQSILDQ